MVKEIVKGVKKISRVLTYSRNSFLGNNLDEFGNIKTDGTIDTQKQKNRDYIHNVFSNQNIPYKIVEELVDDGWSGKDTERPGFKKLEDYVDNQEVDVIVVSELSRISRNVRDFLDFMEKCEKNKVDVMIIGMNLDTRTPFGKAMLTILVALAQFEREMTSVRLKDNTINRLLNKKKINGTTEVLGLIKDLSNKEKGHFVPHKEELKTLNQIFKIYLNQPSLLATAKEVKELELTNRNGVAITKGQIEGMVMNARWRYRGLWHYNLKNKDLDQELLQEKDKFRSIDLLHGSVVDIELLQRVVEKSEMAALKKERTGKENYTYLVTKLLSDEDGNSFEVDCSTPSKEQNIRHRYYKNKVTTLILQ